MTTKRPQTIEEVALLVESLLAFRRRMIFVSEDALDRASRFATEPLAFT